MFFLFIIILVSNSFFVKAIGVTPVSYEIDFQPNLKGVFAFTFLGDGEPKFSIYAEGDLAEYVKLSDKTLNGPGTIVAFLSLPENIEIPGRHILYIGALEGGGEEVSGIGIIGNVRGVILVNVPYPGKYVEIKLEAANVNIGEPVPLSLTINNKGKENVTVSAALEIYKGEELIERINLDDVNLGSAQSKLVYYELNTINYQAGGYKARALAEYGGKRTAIAETDFKIGHLHISILNYSASFVRNKINKFNIEIESEWNTPIENVFANVSIINTDISFQTPSVKLRPFEKSILEGFFDTTSIVSDEFQAKIEIHYEDQITEKIVDLRLKKEFDLLSYAIIAAFVIVIIILVLIVIIIQRKLSRLKKK